MKRTLAAVGACVLTFFCTIPAMADVNIVVDKQHQEMIVEAPGFHRVWPVSTARAGYITPSGTYGVVWMTPMTNSAKYNNSPMPHSLFFIGSAYAIHGTMEEGELGRPASHGCVRLSRNNAATLYDLVLQNGQYNTHIRIQ